MHFKIEELLEFYLGAAALAGLVKWRFWPNERLDLLTLMKGDERVELSKEGADGFLFGNSWHENLLIQKMGGIQFVGRISRRSDCFRKNGSHYPFKLNCVFPIGVIIINFMPIHWEKFRNNAVSDVVSHKSTELKIRIWMALERDIALTHDVSSRVNVIGLNRFWVLKKHPGDGYPVIPSEGPVVTLIDSIEFVPQPTLFPIISRCLLK